MKKFILFLCIFSCTLSYSQTELTKDLPTSSKRWMVKFGLNLIENSGTGGPFDFSTGKAFKNPFAIGLEYSFSDQLSVSLFQSINKWDANDDMTLTEDESFFGIDADLKFYFDEYLFNVGWLDLYLDGGLGVFSGKDTALSVNTGGGGIIWLSETFGLNSQMVVKFAGDDNFPNNHVQYFAGLVFKFGGIDSDNDGILDKEDECPNNFGLIQFNGCPDTDGDGVKESLDECPLAAGPLALKGCPDDDGDGVANKNDECPQVKGSVNTRGCPDKDNDGVPDKFDRCPEVPGSFNNKGCPWKDVDKDGVLDKDDKCPNQIGPVSNNGCPYPKLSQESKQKIESFAKTILFNLGKADLTQSSLGTLNEIIIIMKTHGNEKFLVAGHTSNTFTKEFNRTLSKNRATTVRNYMISKGINPSRLTAKGYGEEQPVASNSTEEGKRKNRRVDIILIK